MAEWRTRKSVPSSHFSLQVDDKTSAALIDFSLHLTVGDMDKAYAAVRLIKSTTVWANMAHMCVKTRRLDVAEVSYRSSTVNIY